SDLRHGYDAIVVGIISEGKGMRFNPQADFVLRSEDVIICLGHKDDMERLKRAANQIAVDHLLEGQELIEIEISPNSLFDGVLLQDVAFKNRFNVMPLAVVSGGKEVKFMPTANLRLSSDDVVICLGHRTDLEALRVAAGDLEKIPLLRVGLELERIKISTGARLQGVLLKDASIRDVYHCNVVAVQRPGESLLLNPSPDYCFATEDLLICLGLRGDLTRLRAMLTRK
ncbi:MAG: hypothetical protein HQM02_08835, partial [Magnetococcales bacterium]|nr:hypothetical protein [Magnetococcales bacterium]